MESKLKNIQEDYEEKLKKQKYDSDSKEIELKQEVEGNY